MESREERIARNEALFGEVNNRIVDVGSSSLGLEVVCECGDGACDDVLPISIDEYAQIRSEPTLFLVVPGHDAPEVEEIVSGTDRFDVVHKHLGREESPGLRTNAVTAPHTRYGAVLDACAEHVEPGFPGIAGARIDLESVS